MELADDTSVATDNPLGLISCDDSLNEPPAFGVYRFGSSDVSENREEYRSGGFHPVHLGDKLSEDGRYRVLHKLGNGGFATVWLCRDAESDKLVAVKILKADVSQEDCKDLRILHWLKEGNSQLSDDLLSEHLITPLDQFWITGPNGRHLCLILPVVGPVIDSIWHQVAEPEKLLPRAALQATRILQRLHRLSICHGDFRPANILSKVHGLDTLSDEKVSCLLGEPETDPVLRSDRRSPGPEAPEYVVDPADFLDTPPEMLTANVCLIDFGESYQVCDPPETLGIPGAWRSPELLLGSKTGVLGEVRPGIPSDLWALGCTIFEIVTGRRLFPDWDGDGEDVILQWVQLFGRLPDPWWDAWDKRGQYFDEEGTPLVMSDGTTRARKYTMEEYLAESLTVQFGLDGVKHTLEVPETHRSLLADLLSQLLRYNPEERISVDEVLNHAYWKDSIQD